MKTTAFTANNYDLEGSGLGGRPASHPEPPQASSSLLESTGASKSLSWNLPGTPRAFRSREASQAANPKYRSYIFRVLPWDHFLYIFPRIIDAGIATQVGGHAGEGVSELRGALGSFRIGDSQAGRHLTTPIWTQNRIYTHPKNPGRVFFEVSAGNVRARAWPMGPAHGPGPWALAHKVSGNACKVSGNSYKVSGNVLHFLMNC